MVKIIRLVWGVLPVAIVSLCWIFISVIERITGDTLRNFYRNLLIFLWITSFGIVLLWGKLKFNAFRQKVDAEKANRIVFSAISILINVLSAFVMGCLILGGAFFAVLSYRAERITVRNDIKLVACVDYFSGVTVDYYQYKNPLFYGKRLGFERYVADIGDPLAESRGYPPLEWSFWDLDGNILDSGSNEIIWGEEIDEEEMQKQIILREKAEIRELDAAVMDYQEDELVFSFSIDDFIDSFNGYYWEDYESRYLLPSSMWISFVYESSIHSKYASNYYYFTPDEKLWSLPTVSVFTPSDESYVQEIMLNFDDHSYTESMYHLYERTCFYTIKVLFPSFDDAETVELYTKLNELAYQNVFPNEQGYSSDSIPAALFYKDGIGLYPYFAIGESVHLCVIPVTDQTITAFEAKGTAIYEIPYG